MFAPHLGLKMAALVLMCASIAGAQRADNTTSPQMLPDHKVTFRLRASRATQVTLTGDWQLDAKAVALAKDDSGVWSVTVGPLASGIAIYNFTVEGLNSADPINPRMKPRARTSASLVEVPPATA